MIQSAYDYSETLGAPRNYFPQDTIIQHILNDTNQREAFEFDLMELAGRVTRPIAPPETELFYQVCYEGIHGQMFEGVDGEGRVWLPYGDFTARLNDQETQQAYKMALEQALEIVKSDRTEIVEAREALYRLGMFWYLRGAVSEP
ncbi:hypothetical protein SLS60_005758 [Paraconiothyrium brasiliense]|uniref:Uncharacterized protein n=1 Tax=Paraconiothyrium brasiliense TaxID=300254 RepID=A0ABR3RDA2_9PLEO